jgi:antiviral helicase SKI2
MLPQILESKALFYSPNSVPLDLYKTDGLAFEDEWFGRVRTLYKKNIASLIENPCHFDDNLMHRFNRTYKIKMANDMIKLYEEKMKDEHLSLFSDFQNRVKVLETLNYVEKVSNTPNIKGRIACEINTCPDELLVTEIIFNNILEPLSPEECAGILSALVFQDRKSMREKRDSPPLTEKMEVARAQIKEIQEILKKIQTQENVGTAASEESEPVLNFGLSAVVYEWACQKPFKDIAVISPVYEGSIVKCISRLDELLRDMKSAAKVVGN